MNNPDNIIRWEPPADWIRIQTIDAHTAGEPLRIILSGFPVDQGATILERRRNIHSYYDHLRKALMWEPRGHSDMYGCLVTPPVSQGADFGVIFTHNEGYSTMCGHGIIAVTKVLIETGYIPKKEPQTTLKIDTPAGMITATAHISEGMITKITFENVPSFVCIQDGDITLSGFGKIKFDVAFGGAFYVLIDAKKIGLRCTVDYLNQFIQIGMAIKDAVSEKYEIKHPYEGDLSFLYGTIFIGPAENSLHHSRNVCIFANGEVDRSPTGTGVSARIAAHYAYREVARNQEILIESIIGTTFGVKVLRETEFGPYPAVIPQISGTAFITGKHEFFIDPRDPLKEGFFLR